MLCEYQRINLDEKNQPPMCTIINELCTLCVVGNRGIYNEAKGKERKK